MYDRNKILSKGFNKSKTHPLAAKYYEYPFIHAEMDALIHLDKSAEGLSIAIIRVNPNSGRLLLSKPCSDCMRLLRVNKIKDLIYSTNNGFTKVRIY